MGREGCLSECISCGSYTLCSLGHQKWLLWLICSSKRCLLSPLEKETVLLKANTTDARDSCFRRVDSDKAPQREEFSPDSGSQQLQASIKHKAACSLAEGGLVMSQLHGLRHDGVVKSQTIMFANMSALNLGIKLCSKP